MIENTDCDRPSDAGDATNVNRSKSNLCKDENKFKYPWHTINSIKRIYDKNEISDTVIDDLYNVITNNRVVDNYITAVETSRAGKHLTEGTGNNVIVDYTPEEKDLFESLFKDGKKESFNVL